MTGSRPVLHLPELMETIDKKNLLAQLTDALKANGRSSDSVVTRAMELLAAKGLPHSKSEEYRFTPVVRSLEGQFAISNTVTPVVKGSLQLLPEISSNLVVFVNGKYSPEHSKVNDKELHITLSAPSTPQPEQDPFDLLNTAFAEHKIDIQLGDRLELKNPIAVVHYIDSPGFVFANPKWSMSLGEGSKATVLEYTIAADATNFFNNKQSFIDVRKGAQLDFITLQLGGKGEVTVNNSVVRLADTAQAICYTCTLDGKLIRNNLTMVIDGEGVNAHLNGLYLVSGNSLVDNHTVVDHRKPNSYSNELYKGVMDENGKAVFNGKIFVRPDAQKTNAFQSNRNILLSESSNIHTKPQLEIWADDVKCSHGCTTGQLDEEALFYLRSRGIPHDTARGMLLNAFGSETLEGIHDERIRNFVESIILRKLNPVQGS